MCLNQLLTISLLLLFLPTTFSQVFLEAEAAFDVSASTFRKGGFEMDDIGNTYATFYGGGAMTHSNGQVWGDGPKIMKHDAEGNLLWCTTAPSGSISDIKVSPSHNLFITGIGDVYPSSFDSLGMFSNYSIAMLDSAGNYIWALQVPGSPYIAPLPNGNVAFALKVGLSISNQYYFGDTLYNNYFHHVLIGEIDTQGEVVWSKISPTGINSPTQSPNEITGVNYNNGKLYMYGYSTSYFQFDSLSISPHNMCGNTGHNQDMYFAEFDISMRQFTAVETTTKMEIIDIDFDQQGNIYFLLKNYVVGNCTSDPPYPSFLGYEFPIPELHDVHILKSNSELVFQETHDLGGVQNQNSAWLRPGEIMVSGNKVFASFFNQYVGEIYIPDYVTSPTDHGNATKMFIVGFDQDLNYKYHSSIPCTAYAGVYVPNYQLASKGDYGAYISYGEPQYLPNAAFYKYHINQFKLDANIISGRVYKDFDQNESFDNNDQPVTGNVVQITPNPYLVVTHSDGRYEAYVDTGAYYLNIMNIPPYYSQVPSTDTVTFSSVDSLAERDLRLEPVPGAHDVGIDIIQMNQMVVGDTVSHKIIVTNHGTYNENVTVYFSPLSYSIPFSSFGISPSMSSVGNYYTANILNMAPGTQEEYIVTYGLGIQFLDIIGESSSHEVECSIIPTDVDLQNNIASINQVPVAPYDPNIKRVNEPQAIHIDDIDQYEWLNYTIYFQNEGNAPAIDVRIKDEVDTSLILSSLQIIDASDELSATILGREITFHFDSIMLPSINVDEDGSIGYVSFKLKRKDNLVVGDSIKNTANIYFDYNPPITTNTIVTRIFNDVGTNQITSNDMESIIIFPNPNREKLYVGNLKNDSGNKTILIRDLTGKIYISKEIDNQDVVSIDTRKLTPGIYLVQVGRIIKKLIIQ